MCLFSSLAFESQLMYMYLKDDNKEVFQKKILVMDEMLMIYYRIRAQEIDRLIH